MSSFAFRGVWGGTGNAGNTRESVSAYVGWLADLGFNAIFLGLKQGDGTICWPSSRFPEAVDTRYQSFDLPQVFLEECEKRNVQAHAWFIDYYESENGAAYRLHPEWAALNAHGLPTSEETLRGKRYSSVWMCPARTPGYTDEWLVPMYEEFASRYPFTSLHHDYIRYPGDLAPDQYCFCDYCVENLPKWAGYVHEVFPDETFLHELYDRPYLESHWEQSPRVLPPQWDRLPRSEKARFLLEGAYFGMGRTDLDYFFYRYRIEAINRFAKLSYDAVKNQNPNIKLSGAYFKNPIHSGRFIGQDWREFSAYSEICIPMDYRDHYPGTMDQYCELLKETISSQKVWSQGYEQYYPGFALWPLFKEETEPPYPAEKVRQTLIAIQESNVGGYVVFCDGDLKKFDVESTFLEFN